MKNLTLITYETTANLPSFLRKIHCASTYKMLDLDE